MSAGTPGGCCHHRVAQRFSCKKLGGLGTQRQQLILGCVVLLAVGVYPACRCCMGVSSLPSPSGLQAVSLGFPHKQERRPVALQGSSFMAGLLFDIGIVDHATFCRLMSLHIFFWMQKRNMMLPVTSEKRFIIYFPAEPYSCVFACVKHENFPLQIPIVR